eukprot:6175295-Pleurochrysis_carterae.AAC.8
MALVIVEAAYPISMQQQSGYAAKPPRMMRLQTNILGGCRRQKASGKSSCCALHPYTHCTKTSFA